MNQNETGEYGDQSLPEPSPEDDAEYAEYLAWSERERAEGREKVPGTWENEGPAVSISLGDAAGVDPALLAAMSGPHGLGGQALSPLYGQDQAADVLRPGPVLAALTEQAVSDIPALTDGELMGALSAARRLENRAAYLQTVVIAEFARRREVEREEARARRVPKARRPGEYPDAELAMELVSSANYAAERIGEATDLVTRLPRTLAGLAAGTIDTGRACIIYRHTWCLKPADAARADEILAAVAPGLRWDQLDRKAAALEMKLDPEAVRRRRELARKDGRRVEVSREYSGNAAIAGRELDPAEVMAAKANIDALAVKLRSGNVEGTLQHLRAFVLSELLQGRNPLDHIRPAGPPAQDACPPAPGHGFPDDGYCYEGDEEDRDEEDRDEEDEEDGAAGRTVRARSGPRAPAEDPAPMPAQINLLVPVGNLLGWSTAPALAGGWGLLDPEQTRAVVAAASRNSRTRWCCTLIAPDGSAIAHGCASGRHPWTPARPPGSAGKQPSAESSGSRDGPSLGQAAEFADLLRRLDITFHSIAKDECGHGHAEDRYTPSRKLKHLVRARTATCPAPGCDAPSYRGDLDHTIPYPAGATDECNLSPPCRRHHRVKQSPGWKLDQPEPGVMRWTTPAGRTYTTNPTVYEIT